MNIEVININATDCPIDYTTKDGSTYRFGVDGIGWKLLGVYLKQGASVPDQLEPMMIELWIEENK